MWRPTLNRGSVAAGAVLLAFVLLAPKSSATALNLGEAANYALFAGPNANSFSFMGASNVTGNVAIGAGGQINWSLPATVTGNMYLADASANSSGVTVTGSTYTNYNLNQAVSDAEAAATLAASLSPTTSVLGGRINVTSASQSLTLKATGTQTVLDVSSITLTNGNLTLNGTANDVFIINVTGQQGLNLSGSSSILLTGGLTASDVLFNVEASGGNAVSMQGTTSAVINGTILALNTGVSLNDDTLNGAIIANFRASSSPSPSGSSQNQSGITANNSQLETSGATINYIGFGGGEDGSVPEPATLTLSGLGVVALLVVSRRKQLANRP
jgi:hypothetical protein